MYVMPQRKTIGIFGLVVATIIPLLLWVTFTPAPKTDPIIKMTGLGALSLLSCTIILSARFRFLDTYFFGLDRTYRIHRLCAEWVALLALLHSALLTVKYMDISLLSAYQFVIPSTDFALMAGKLALYIMTSLISLILLFKLKYSWFILSMRIMGAVIFLGGYHALFVNGSDLRQNVPLFIYMLILASSASMIFVYRSLFHGRTTKLFKYKVDQINGKGAITEMWLSALGRPLNHYAGQFAFIRFVGSEVSDETHPFTISSGSEDPRLRFSIKNLGDYTALIQRLKPGDHAIIEGAFGAFTFSRLAGKKQTWVAGGIGITPFLAMAHSLTNAYHVTLFYCVKTAVDAVYLPELEEISKQLGRTFRVVPVYTDAAGPVTAKELFDTRADEFLLCGPPQMMKAIKKGLLSNGVKRSRIHYEEFDLS